MNTENQNIASSPKTLSVGDTYSAGGVKREILARSGDIVLGARVPDPKVRDGAHFDCEIMEVQRFKTDQTWPSGNVTPAGSEFLPGASSWGTYGFSVIDLEKAKVIFDAMAAAGSQQKFAELFRQVRDSIN
jgi:hypothetical protein